MHWSIILFIIVFGWISIRFFVISFEIIRNKKTINFSLFTPTVVKEKNKKYLLFYSLAVAVVALFMVISAIYLKSYYLTTMFFIIYFVLLYRLEQYTK